MIFKNGSASIWSLTPEHVLWLLLWQNLALPARRRDDRRSNLRSVSLLGSESESSLAEFHLGRMKPRSCCSWDHHSPLFSDRMEVPPYASVRWGWIQTSHFKPDRSRLKMWTSDLYELKSEGFRVHAGAMDHSQPLISGLLLPISPKQNCSLVHKQTTNQKYTITEQYISSTHT